MNDVKRWLVAVAVLLGLSVPASAQEGLSVRISSNILWRLFLLLDEEQDDSSITMTLRQSGMNIPGG